MDETRQTLGEIAETVRLRHSGEDRRAAARRFELQFKIVAFVVIFAMAYVLITIFH